MAIQGTLSITSMPGGLGCLVPMSSSYSVIECAYEFNQSIDDTGKPTSRPRGGTITFVMPTPADDASGSAFFYQWMFDKSKTHSGKFTFIVYADNNKRCEKHVEFIDAYCVGLKEYFNDNDSRLMYTTVTISAEQIIISGAMFDNQW